MALRWMSGLFSLGLFLSSSQAAEVPLNGHVFTLPDGFTIELAADAKLVPHPISADFDELGRLYVTDSSGTNDPSKKQLEDKPHRIVRLEDTNSDGAFDKSTVWADKLMFPEGALWHAGSLYVAAPPSIWKLTDNDNDGVADKREEWFKGETLTGCANDLHGPFLGPDGWIYWCKGAFAEQNHTINGKPFKTKASHVFRARPDGSGLDVVMTGGMDNPVDIAFMPNGDRIVSNTFLVHPGSGKAGERDGLIHAIHGSVFGKEHNVLDGHVRTGELMPILSHMGAAAPCGLTRYDNDVLGSDYRDNLFTCQFNKHKVSRHVLTTKGAGYESADSDFVVSNNIDFHPTDVFEDADGSLLIVDTGGWYKLCCPTSQLHKPDILGAIYRVRRIDASKIDDPRGLKIDWSKLNDLEEDKLDRGALQRLIADKRPIVSQKARDRRTQLEFAADPNLKQPPKDQCHITMHFPPLAQQSVGVFAPSVRNMLWSAYRVAGRDALPYVRGHLSKDAHPTIQQAALHIVSAERDKTALCLVGKLLEANSSTTRRLAAEAIGRMGVESKYAISRAILHAAERGPDRAEQHAYSYALVEIGDVKAITEGLTIDNSNVRRVALIAADQLADAGLKAEQVTPLLTSTDVALKDTARWIVGHHPEWGGALAGFFEQQLSKVDRDPTVSKSTTGSAGAASPTEAELLEEQLTQFALHPTIQELLAKSVVNRSLTNPARELVLRAIGRSKPKELSPLWAESLTRLISSDDELRKSAVVTARSLPATKQPHADYHATLLAVSNNTANEPAVRLAAMATIANGLSALDDAQFTFVTSHLKPTDGIADRAAAADIIAVAKLSGSQLDALTGVIQESGPIELDRLLGPYERSADEAVGMKLIASLKQARSLASLRMDVVKQKLAKYSPAVQKGVDELNSLVNVDAGTQKARIEELLPQMTKGDVRRGLAVFNSQKASCIACHKLAYLGGNVGPDLSKIGGIRTERDLLESILYPSLSFVRSYEPVTIITQDGKVYNGLVRSETATEITLATGLNQEARVNRSDIEEQRPGTVSVMPAGLDKQISVQEMADLITFLKSTK